MTTINSIWYVYGDPDTRFKVTEIKDGRVHFNVYTKEGKGWLKTRESSISRKYWQSQIDNENIFEIKSS